MCAGVVSTVLLILYSQTVKHPEHLSYFPGLYPVDEGKHPLYTEGS